MSEALERAMRGDLQAEQLYDETGQDRMLVRREAPGQHKQEWIANVDEALREPVIYTESIASHPVFSFLSPTGDPQDFLQAVHPSGKMSGANLGVYLGLHSAMRHAVNDMGLDTASARQWVSSEEGISYQLAQNKNRFAALTDTLDDGDQTAFTDANYITKAIAGHAPGGALSKYASRTDSDAAKLREQYGSDAEFMLTDPESQDSYRALAIAELLSARNPDYVAGGMTSQFLQGVQTFPSAGSGTAKEVSPQQADNREMMRLRNDPEGRFAIASMYWGRQAPRDGSSFSIYDSEDRPRFATNSTTTLPGLGKTMYSASYPIGYGVQELSGIRQLPTVISAALDGDYKHADNLADLNIARTRITPQRPDAIDAGTFKQVADAQEDIENRGLGWHSAYFGPMFADAYNTATSPIRALIGMNKMPRTYLTPAAEVAAQAPENAMSDPINVLTFALPPVMAGASKLLKAGTPVGRVREAAKALGAATRVSAGTLADDAVQEIPYGVAITNAVSPSPFTPQKTNAFMDDMDPNDPEYDKKFRQNEYEWRQKQRAITGTYGDLQKPKRK